MKANLYPCILIITLQAKDWLSSPAALPGRLGELAVRQILEDALKISSRCVSSEDHEAINMAVSDIKSMMDTVCELRRQGMVRILLLNGN